MITHNVHYRFGPSGPQLRGPKSGIVGRIVAGIVGAVALVVGLALSFAVFVGVATLAVIAGGWLLWKTRALRKHMREQMNERPAGGRIIEGEVIRDAARDDSSDR